MSTNASWQQATHILRLFDEKNVPREQIQKLYASGLLADLLDANIDEVNRDAFRQLLGLTLTSAEYRHITLDYGLSLEQMVTAGHYDWTNSDITTEQFPIKGGSTVTLETKLFHFDRRLSSEAVVEYILKADLANPWQVAKIEHGLAYGATYPEEQRQFPIVVLGSSYQLRGYRCVSVLGRYVAERGLGLSGWVGDWSTHDRFLAVRPLSVRLSAD